MFAKLSAADLSDIAAEFDRQASIADNAAGRAKSVRHKRDERMQSYVWRKAAAMLRSTEIKLDN